MAAPIEAAPLPQWVQAAGTILGLGISAGVAAWANRKGKQSAEPAKESEGKEVSLVAASVSGADHDRLVLESVKRIADGLDVANRSLDDLEKAQDRTTAAVDRMEGAVRDMARQGRDH